MANLRPIDEQQNKTLCNGSQNYRSVPCGTNPFYQNDYDDQAISVNSVQQQQKQQNVIQNYSHNNNNNPGMNLETGFNNLCINENYDRTEHYNCQGQQFINGNYNHQHLQQFQQKPLPPPPPVSSQPLLQPPRPHQREQQPHVQQYGQSNLNVVQQGFNQIWGSDSVDLLQTRNIWPAEGIEIAPVNMHPYLQNSPQCDPELFRCSFSKIPENKKLLEKTKLPLAVTIHPFKDIDDLSVIQTHKIVRCQSCRTYINPFVGFGESRRWSCNICYRSNDLPDEFFFDPTSQNYGDPTRRPEIRNSTVEFIAPEDYMLRPPQPAAYLFLIDVSSFAVNSGYLSHFCNILINELDNLPGDGRSMIGFIAFDSSLYFYSINNNQTRPHEMIVCELEDILVPYPRNLMVNIKENRAAIIEFLTYLPSRFSNSFDRECALGSATRAGYTLLSNIGGRMTIFLTSLPTKEPGRLEPREDPTKRSDKDNVPLQPAMDFYKRIALDCNDKQIAVDLFVLNSQYVDLASISGISKYSGGSIHHFPQYKMNNKQTVQRFENSFRRYLQRKIGFEAVMRTRCTRGVSIHSFHGHFFVRSTDLVVLPNVNPDSAYAVHLNIDDNLAETRFVSIQAALLYTSAVGERRIRVHTICLPVTASLQDLYMSADQSVIVSLFAKMGVDRALQSNLTDAKEALVNHVIFMLSAYADFANSSNQGLMIPKTLRLLPLLVLALLKYDCFRSGKSIRVDDRVMAMCNLKTLPLSYFIQSIYPDFYSIADLLNTSKNGDEYLTDIPRLPLNSINLSSSGIYLLDNCDKIILFVGSKTNYESIQEFVGNYFDANYEGNLPNIDTTANKLLHRFIEMLNSRKPYDATVMAARDNNDALKCFVDCFVEDKSESLMSYVEFLQHLKENLN